MEIGLEHVKAGIAWILAAPPLAIGYAAGMFVKGVRLFWAAVVEGYHRGSKL
jgi:hypothetical protein